jgi:hypothetical protein
MNPVRATRPETAMVGLTLKAPAIKEVCPAAGKTTEVTGRLPVMVVLWPLTMAATTQLAWPPLRSQDREAEAVATTPSAE